MTRRTNARIAGFTFLFYIAVGITALLVGDGAAAGEGAATRLTSMARHAGAVRLDVVLGLLACFSALVLAVALYGLTRDEDRDLAILAMCFRVAEGVVGAAGGATTLGLLAVAPDETTAAVAEVLFKTGGWSPVISAAFFSIGSTVFCWLLLRGRMIPVPLAWLGVAASLLLVVALPLQIAGFLQSPVTMLIWLPIAAFEIPLGLWLLVKGVAPRPATRAEGWVAP